MGGVYPSRGDLRHLLALELEAWRVGFGFW